MAEKSLLEKVREGSLTGIASKLIKPADMRSTDYRVANRAVLNLMPLQAVQDAQKMAGLISSQVKIPSDYVSAVFYMFLFSEAINYAISTTWANQTIIPKGEVERQKLVVGEVLEEYKRKEFHEFEREFYKRALTAEFAERYFKANPERVAHFSLAGISPKSSEIVEDEHGRQILSLYLEGYLAKLNEVISLRLKPCISSSVQLTTEGLIGIISRAHSNMLALPALDKKMVDSYFGLDASYIQAFIDSSYAPAS